jgi:hypothetical protein
MYNDAYKNEEHDVNLQFLHIAGGVYVELNFLNPYLIPCIGLEILFTCHIYTDTAVLQPFRSNFIRRTGNCRDDYVRKRKAFLESERRGTNDVVSMILSAPRSGRIICAGRWNRRAFCVFLNGVDVYGEYTSAIVGK